MSVSTTRTFNPEFAEILTEAYSRCLIRPQTINQEHIRDAIRSANLMLVDFSNAGVQQYRLIEQEITLVSGQAVYSLAVGTLDVWSMVFRRDDQDTPVWPMSRTDYQRIPNKTQEGRPYNYFCDRASIDNGQRTISLYPTPERDGDTLQIWALTRSLDAVQMRQNLTVAYEGFEAYCSSLARRLARKYAPELIGGQTGLAQEELQAWNLWRGADKERSPLRIRMRGYSSPRRGGSR